MKRMIIALGAVTMLLGGIGCEGEQRTLRWSWAPPAPMPKSNRATAVMDEKIVTVGGTFWVEREGEKDLKIWETRVDLLNTKTMAWKKLPQYPRPAGYPYATFIGSIFVTTEGDIGTKSYALYADGSFYNFVGESSQVRDVTLALEGASAAVPEPSTLGLLGVGAISMVVYTGRRRRRRPSSSAAAARD